MSFISTPWNCDRCDGNSGVALEVLPASNGENVPKLPNTQLVIVAQDEKIKAVRRRFGMGRRDFVRTAAPGAIGVGPIDAVSASMRATLRAQGPVRLAGRVTGRLPGRGKWGD